MPDITLTIPAARLEAIRDTLEAAGDLAPELADAAARARLPWVPRYVFTFHGSSYGGITDAYDVYVAPSLAYARQWLADASRVGYWWPMDHYALDGTNAPALMPGVGAGDTVTVGRIREGATLADACEGFAGDIYDNGDPVQFIVTDRGSIRRA